MIRISINPAFYNFDGASATGWSLLSPWKSKFPDFTKFALVIGKSADVVIKSNYSIHDTTFGGSRAIVINHVGAELTDAMFHSIVNNVNQYDYLVQILDFMSRGYIEVRLNNVLLTESQVANFSI